ncbi:hypothetical protein BCR32DRAFT_276787 [Anaeromyces robustus]|uniref:Uncharacterized protein n=1 Tax=Anaeromyces robustus TaxID=1754192 RepID=A0A1Y1XHE6_9FUNG|nr:hypothetical protein BCR32DRAFT_276787 [Anaeromyces robustus]|eukprot:ORX84816.1 hypothetical protein BCR32DRAFT_276787 [Anaeromyces robustus]
MNELIETIQIINQKSVQVFSTFNNDSDYSSNSKRDSNNDSDCSNVNNDSDNRHSYYIDYNMYYFTYDR